MNTKERITRDKKVVKRNIIIGAVLLCLGVSSGVAFISNILEGKETEVFELIVSFAIFGLPGISLLIKSIKNKKLIELFKNYVSTMSAASNGSISNIAKTTGKNQDFVKIKISKMIEKKYFINAKIQGDQLLINNKILTKEEKLKAVGVRCKTCGAVGRNVLKENSFCEYCGSTL